MTSELADFPVGCNALRSTAPVTLPDTMVKRAQSVTRSVIMRWLRGVISGDSNGYAVISGGGRTLIILYGGEQPLSATVIRGFGGHTMVEALETLRSDEASDFFAMTYHLPEGAPVALAGLFGTPDEVVRLDDPRPQLKEFLEPLLDSRFTGSLVLRHQQVLWANILIVDGGIIGCYGSDDAHLKGTIDDAMAILRLDEVDVASYPTFAGEGLEEVISFNATNFLTGNVNELVAATEGAMIELLSELDSAVSKLTDEDEPPALVESLVRSYQRALQLVQSGPEIIASDPPAHPLLDAHWIVDQRAVDTDGLMRTLEMAAIPDAWLAASDALILALESTVEQQLTWLSMADQLSARSLQEALAELLSQCRQQVRNWRQVRRSPASQTNRPFQRFTNDLTIR